MTQPTNVHPIFAPILAAIGPKAETQTAEPVPVNLSAERPRCTSHVWREEPYGDGAPDGAMVRSCTRCGVSYDEIEAELHDVRAEYEALNDDCNAETERADRAEMAAKLNGETIAMQQAEHAKALAELHSRYADQTRQLALLRKITGEMASAVVELADGKSRTLWSLYETGDYRELCSVCRDETCGGHRPSAAEVTYEHLADVESGASSGYTGGGR